MTGASLEYSGNYSGAALSVVGTHGYWWSSTVLSTVSSYLLGTNTNGGINPNSNGSKYVARAVRYAEYPVCA
ncbi:hypothetical protein IKG12_01675 [Candidatus Saccharibacteria bacterium]|nr:hypothetical protein [Candidatus Saccharibacteria bacterium]